MTDNMRRFRPTKSKSDPSNILISEHSEVNEVSEVHSLVCSPGKSLTFTPKQPRRLNLSAVRTSRRCYAYIYRFNGRKWTIWYKWTFCMFYNELELPSGNPQALDFRLPLLQPISGECACVSVSARVGVVIHITVLVYPVWSVETHNSMFVCMFVSMHGVFCTVLHYRCTTGCGHEMNSIFSVFDS